MARVRLLLQGREAHRTGRLWMVLAATTDREKTTGAWLSSLANSTIRHSQHRAVPPDNEADYIFRVRCLRPINIRHLQLLGVCERREDVARRNSLSPPLHVTLPAHPSPWRVPGPRRAAHQQPGSPLLFQNDWQLPAGHQDTRATAVQALQRENAQSLESGFPAVLAWSGR